MKRTVVDASLDVAGAYCAKLLGEAGAEVTHLEPPGGDPLRRWSMSGSVAAGEDGALFRYLRHGHRSMVIAQVDLPAQVDLLAQADLLARADVVICRADVDGGQAGDLVARFPHLVVVAITPFGLGGPYAGRPASDLTVQAESGGLDIRGRPETPPIQAAGRIVEWVAGAYAAFAALAALRGGGGALIDLSRCEVANLTATNFFSIAHGLRGSPPLEELPPARNFETPSIEPTADGYVGFNTNTRPQLDAFLLLIEHPEMIETGEWGMAGARAARWHEWNTLVHEWTTRHTTAEIVERAALLRIPVAPVSSGKTVTEIDHLIDRRVFVSDPTGTFRLPRRPWMVDGEQPPPPRPAPRLGEHGTLTTPAGTTAASAAPAPGREAAAAPGTEPSAAAPRAAAPDGNPALGPRSPLAGLRVLDMTAWWAGPSASGLLAAMGADVLHVESVGRLDGMRLAGGMFADRPQWWEYSPFFLQANLNKRGITLALDHPAGRALALRLVEWADVVVENFTPRVIEGFDLDWDVVHAANPRAVMVRMPAFGLDGPWRDRPGFAQTMEQLTGLAWVTGFPDDQPRIQRGPCDPNGGVHAAIAALVALDQCDRTGQGCVVEAPMIESALAVAAEPILEWTAYGNVVERDGNRSPWAAPQGVYPGVGTQRWLAVAVDTDAQWPALARVLDRPDLAEDPRLADLAGRRAAHDELDKVIAAWAGERDPADAAAVLRAAGVPAAPVVDVRTTDTHPQLVARGYYEQVEHPVAGTVAVPTLPLLSGAGRWVRRPAPTVGQHNTEVLAGLLGCREEELAQLEADHVIGTWPLGT